MNSFARLRQRWDQLLDDLKRLEPMRSGSICSQTIHSTAKDGSRKTNGPYLIHTYKHRGKTVTRRLRHPQQIEQCRRQIANFRRFQELTAELVQIGQRLADCEDADDQGCKKNSRR